MPSTQICCYHRALHAWESGKSTRGAAIMTRGSNHRELLSAHRRAFQNTDILLARGALRTSKLAHHAVIRFVVALPSWSALIVFEFHQQMTDRTPECWSWEGL